MHVYCDTHSRTDVRVPVTERHQQVSSRRNGIISICCLFTLSQMHHPARFWRSAAQVREPTPLAVRTTNGGPGTPDRQGSKNSSHGCVHHVSLPENLPNEHVTCLPLHTSDHGMMRRPPACSSSCGWCRTLRYRTSRPSPASCHMAINHTQRYPVAQSLYQRRWTQRKAPTANTRGGCASRVEAHAQTTPTYRPLLSCTRIPTHAQLKE
mmetsp:Transcript_46128/g.98341  ORF Transcript_46128/g.98341 Transcript_46128/m.98341 type:complete len:209 (+) Transcript_46128:135-761(+)